MSQSDDEGRSESAVPGPGEHDRHDSEPTRPLGQPPYGQPPYGATAQPYGQPQYGQDPYGAQQYGDQQYGQPAHGQQPYGQQPYQPPAAYGNQYGQQYGQAPAYGPYGSAQPAKPGTVVTAAVLGFVFGALGVIFTLLMIAAGSAASSIFGDLSSDPDVTTGIVAIVVVLAVLTAIWTVVTIWGAVWALTGRSRVLLIVGGSIAIALTLFGFLASLLSADTSGAGSVVWILLLLVAAVAMVVLLSVRSSAVFFAAHRARRGR